MEGPSGGRREGGGRGPTRSNRRWTVGVSRKVECPDSLAGSDESWEVTKRSGTGYDTGESGTDREVKGDWTDRGSEWFGVGGSEQSRRTWTVQGDGVPETCMGRKTSRERRPSGEK